MAHWIIDDKGFAGTYYTCSDCGQTYWDIVDDVSINEHCPSCNALIEENEQTSKEVICPICNYSIDSCQCRFGGSAHPDRYKNREVVLDHLYMLSEAQLRHIIKLQTWCQTSYGDDIRKELLNNLADHGYTGQEE